MILGDLGTTFRGLLLAARHDLVIQTFQDHTFVPFSPGGLRAETDPLSWPPKLWPSAVKSDTVTSVKLSYELGKITFSTVKPKLTPGEVSTFRVFKYT